MGLSQAGEGLTGQERYSSLGMLSTEHAVSVRCNELFGGVSVNSTCPATHSVGDPHHAEAFPAAVRHLLEHDEHSATKVHRRTTRRCGKRDGVLTPLDCPATIQKNQFLVFRYVAQHL